MVLGSGTISRIQDCNSTQTCTQSVAQSNTRFENNRTTLLRYRGDSTASRDEVPNSNVLHLTANPPLIGIIKDGTLINHVEMAPDSIVPIQTIIT